MDINILVLIVLFALAIVDFVWIRSHLKSSLKALRLVWIGLVALFVFRYFNSMNFDFALLIVLITAVTGIGALVDYFFVRKTRIAQARAVADIKVQQSSDDQTVTDNELPNTYKEPPFVDFCRSFFPVLFLVLILRSFIFEPFRIPSGSMYPTLEVGDFIVVSKFSYGLRLPVINKKIIPISEPKRGEVVVFKFPEDKRINFIKRVVGLPGDTIVYKDKRLYVNGILQEPEFIGPFSYTERGQSISASEYEETLGEVEHKILISEERRSLSGQWKVPAGHYFVLGDNRDNSKDSRYWNFLPEENLVGKAQFIWLNLDLSGQSGKKFDSSRIGTGIK